MQKLTTSTNMERTRTLGFLLQNSFVRSEVALAQNVQAPLRSLRGLASYSTTSGPATRSSPKRPLPTQDFHSPSISRTSARSIYTTPALLKKGRGKDQVEDTKGGKSRGGKNDAKAAVSSNEGADAGADAAVDLMDFDDVKTGCAKQSEHFTEKLKKFKAGGRFNPDTISSLNVVTDKATGQSYPLRELGQIVPKGGRTISIIVHEAGYIKPVMSAIQLSPDFNQQPQRDPDNELELVLKIEAEKPDDIGKRIKAVCHEWRERIRVVRHKRDKQHTAWKKDGSIRPDDKARADKELEKVIKAQIAEIDKWEKETLKAAQAS